MAFGAKEAALMFRIRGDSSGAESALGRVDARVQGFGSTVGRTAGLWAALGTAAVGALSAIGAQMLQATRAVVDYSARIQQLRVSFTTLLGSASKANALMAQLQRFAASTPFDLEGLSKVAQRMLAVGIATDKVIPLMRDLGNIVAATGEVSAERLEGISTALTQMISKTKVSAEEMEQLAERGVPAWRILSEATGRTQAELRKLAEQGKISSDVMVAALQKVSQQRFGDAMRQQANTFTGSLNIIKNLLMQWSATAFEPLFKEIANLTSKAAKILQSQARNDKPLMEKLGYIMGSYWIDGFEKSFKDFSFVEFYKRQLIDNPVTQMGKGFGEALADIIQGRTPEQNQAPKTPNYNSPSQSQSQSTIPLGAGAIEQAEKARKEAEERAKRDLAARIEIWKNYGQAVVSEFDRVNKSLIENFEQTGDAAAFRAGIENLNKWLIAETTKTQQALMALETAQAEQEKRTSAERELLKQQQTDRLNEWERKAADARNESERLITEAVRKETSERGKITEQAAARELELFKARSATQQAWLDEERRKGVLSEVDYQRQLALEKLGILEKERALLNEQLKRAELDAERRTEIQQRLKILDEELSQQMIANARAVQDAIEQTTEAYDKLKQTMAADAGQAADTPIGPGGVEAGGDQGGGQPAGGGWWSQILAGIGQAGTKLTSFGDVLKQVGTMAADVFMQMGRAMGDMLGQWVLMGDQADVSMKKMVASVLAGVAAQSVTLAVYHTAMGIAALTPWGFLLYGNPAHHFAAAAMWGSIAVGAALGGRAIAGNSFKNQANPSAATGANTQSSRASGGAYSSQAPGTIEGSRNNPAGLGGTLVIRDKSGMFDALFTAAFERNGPMRQRLVQEFGT